MSQTPWRDAATRAAGALAEGHRATLRTARELTGAEVDWPAAARVHVLRNFTVEPLPEYLTVAAARHGIGVATSLAGYDTAAVDARQPTSALVAEPHDAVVLALWLDELREAFDDDGRLDVETTTAYVAELAATVAAATSSLVVLNTFLPTIGGDDPAAIDVINGAVRDLAADNPHVAISDVNRFAADLGRDEAVDTRFLLTARAPMRPALLRAWARDLAGILASVKGRTKKVVALDCDNTLWGGVVGEDGIDGIALDPNESHGRAYYEFQRQLLSLQRRGVLLTLCSRNNEADVLKVLEDHPHSLIRPQHLAGWRINWGDKAANLEELAAELNLGLDAFVFVDDSPTECERIAQALPMVDVLAVGTEPASLLRLVIDYDAWPRLPPTTEDLGRTESYVAERARRTEAASAASLDDFLASLELALHVEVLGDDAPVEAVARVAQLTQRTNQFTTTTLRCTPAEVEAFCGDPGAVVLAGHVRDRFGDYGLTAAAIARRDGSTARVIALLMSCRVLGRGVEAAFLAAVHSEATSRLGVDAMVVDYAPSAKNAPIREFLDGSGLARHDEDGGATYVASAGSAPTAPSHVALSAG